MKKTKIFLISALALLLIPSVALAESWDHSGNGVSVGGGGAMGSGSWDGASNGNSTNTVYGVRVTFVEANGSRTKITVNGKNIYSNSIDLYGNRSSAGVTRVGSNSRHSVCTKPDGSKTYCSKVDLSGSLQTTSGYKWYDASTFGISFGNFITGGGAVPSTSFKTIESEPWKAKKLFEACFGISYDDAYKKAGAQCQNNRQNLERSYIIYEPITSIDSKYGNDSLVATGSELAQSFAYVMPTGLYYTVLPKMGRAVYVDNSSSTCNKSKFSNCNLGLWRITPISQMLQVGNSKSTFDNTARQNWLGYFVGILRSPLPPTNEQWVCDVADYSVDAACVNCDDSEKDTNRSSYVVQDTTSWEGILRSDNDDYICETATAAQKQNVKNYYKTTTGCGNIYCREEVKVIFPNSNDTVTAEKGRYFTVHSPFRDDEKLVKQPYSPDYNEDVAILNETKYDHNWGAIRIQKIKECRMIAKSGTNEQSCLSSNANNLKFKNNSEVSLTYRGSSNNKTDEDKAYEEALTNLKLDVEKSGEFGSGTTQKSSVYASKYVSTDQMLTSNYIFTDVQTTTYKLPGTTFRYIDKESAIYEDEPSGNGNSYIDLGIAVIPVSANNKTFTDSDATLSLSFKLDSDMHLSKAFKKDNDYLPACALKSSGGEESNIYKYVVSNGKISSTGVSGISKAAKATEIANSSCAKLHLCSATSGGMTCKRSGVDSCIKNRTINKIGNTNDTNCYVKNTPSSDGNTNYICNVEVEPGLIELPPVPTPECPGCVDPDPDFDSDPSEKCAIKLPGGSCVPATGYTDIVYRTIDLNNPFPGRTGSTRYTGVNWCAYDEEKGVTSCSGEPNNTDNEVVETYILNNRNVSGYEVYNITPMYTVKLDASTIKAIRSYNSGRSYDDFTLTCDSGDSIKKGRKCTMGSAFQSVANITKNCNDFSSCDGG